MMTKEYKKLFYTIVGSILLVVISITIYIGSNNSKAALERRNIEINSKPAPMTGWGVLKQTIKYPEDFHRAGVDGYADIMFIIDSVGDVINIKIQTNSTVFEDTLRYYLQNIKWSPAKRKGKNVEDSIDCYIRFDSRDLGERFIIIDGK